MESSENGADIVSCQIATSRCKFMRASLHFLYKGLPVKAESNGCHFSDSKTAVKHVVSPSLHGFLEMWEIFRRFVLGDIFHNLPDVPKVSPFGIKRRWVWGLGAIFFWEIIDNIVVFSCLFCVLRSSSDLKVVFWENIGDWFSGIELSRSSKEKLLHHIQEFIILLSVHSWIFDDEAAVFVKCLRHGFAVFGIISRLFEKVWDVYDWNDRLTEESSDLHYF